MPSIPTACISVGPLDLICLRVLNNMQVSMLFFSINEKEISRRQTFII